MLKEKRIKLSNKQIVLIAVICIIFGIGVLGYDYFLSKKDKAYEKMSFALSGIPNEIEETPAIPDNLLSDTEEVIENINNQEIPPVNENPIVETPNQSTSNTSSYNYIGYLEIPKINLTKGFVSINSKYNNVNKNIALMEGSSYPDVDQSLMVIAAHNGTCWNCYFRNLNKLKNGDVIYINYNGIRYIYELVKTYEVKKTGSVAIYRDATKTTLALVTCTWGTKTKQSVFIAELISKESI